MHVIDMEGAGLVDIDSLLHEISPDSPCGDDLEYDPEFGTLERLARGRPEQQFGDTIVEAEQPDWADVQRHAVALLERTKDLRIAAILTRALSHTQGWSGFRDGLGLIRGLLERYWDGLHPLLDPDDDNDPTLRINTLVSLCDPEQMLEVLRLAPLVESRTLGRFGLRDLLVATGELPAPKDSRTPAPEWPVIEAAFKDAELQSLQATADALNQSLAAILAIETRLMEQVGAGAAPDLSDLIALVRAARKAVSGPLTERTGLPATEPLDTADPAADPGAVEPTGRAPARTVLTAIADRDDVVRALDLLCDYYRRQEPSSPVPLLLERARRLVHKDFLEILQDLAPDALPQIKVIRGPESDH